MRTLAALVAVLGLMGAGVVLSSPPNKQPLRVQSVAAPVASAIPGVPAGPPISPRGWIVNSPAGGTFLARQVQSGAAGWQDVGGDGMLGSNSGGDTMFSSPSLGKGHAWIKVRVNGYSEVHIPGRSGFGTGPAAPGGNFTLSNGFTVTAVP